MDKKSKNVGVVSVIALALVLIGVTYAYFSARITGLESASTISLTAGRMGIEYSEDDATVSVSNIYPREEAWITKQITLTGWNTTNQEMKYELGLNIESNTFKGGQLTFDLTGVGTNGTKIADITGKSITKTSGFFKFGTGIFLQSDGETHVYTLKIYFKDNGKDQNMNQEAVFNAKVDVREYGTTIATANQNHNGKHCYTNDYVEGATPANGTAYVDGQYTYKYNMYGSGISTWNSAPLQNGWGVMLTDKTLTDPVATEFCAYIDDKPVLALSYMFAHSKATSVDLSSFDTSNVTTMKGMFFNTSATSLDLSGFDTSSVTTMQYMFSSSSATSLDLSSFDTSNVTNMNGMFQDSVATSIEVGSFSTSNVTDMQRMFRSSKATSLDLSSFDTSNVTDMSYMLQYCEATSLDVSSFDTSKVTNMSWMFSGSKAESLVLSNFNTSNVTDMGAMFYYSEALTIDVSSFDTSNVTTMGSMFFYTLASSLDVSNFDTSKVTNMYSMFAFSYATSIDVSNFDTSNVTSMEHMFEWCDAAVLDLSSFDTSNVTTMESMFSNNGATVGYARTQVDADRFNNVGTLSNGNNPNTSIPNTLTFTVK